MFYMILFPLKIDESQSGSERSEKKYVALRNTENRNETIGLKKVY